MDTVLADLTRAIEDINPGGVVLDVEGEGAADCGS